MRRRSIFIAWLFGLAISAGVPRAQTPAYDLVIRNGRVVDGTGSPWYRADLAIRGDTIARIAPRIESPATRVVDAAGTVVAPGFIHLPPPAPRRILDVPTGDHHVPPGATTPSRSPAAPR